MILRARSLMGRFEQQVERVTESGCWIWIGTLWQSRRGDLRPRIVKYGKPMSAYRLAYEEFVGPIPAGMFVCHRCDVSVCVNPAHLFVGTHKDNMRDMVRKGRASRQIGQQNPRAKLSPEDVPVIRSRYIPHDPLNSQRALAAEFGVSQVTIQAIVKGTRWAHVK